MAGTDLGEWSIESNGITVRSVERRQLGVLFLAAAVLAVWVFAGLQPRRVAGSPRALSVPGPPTVGDCVPDPVNPALWGTVPYDYPQLQFEACDGFRYGEVVAVLANPAKPPASTGNGNGVSVSDPNPTTCLEAGSLYVGAVPLFLHWAPRIYSFSAPFSPSPLQQAVGQHWVACAGFIPANDAQTAVVHYAGSLRDAMSTGNERDILGFCGSGDDWTTGYVLCSSPHDFQVLASGRAAGGDVARDELQRTCVQSAQRLTALPDATDAGALAVEVQSIDNTGASVDTRAGPAEATLGCGINTVDSRRLVGSLVALGDLAIPWE